MRVAAVCLFAFAWLSTAAVAAECPGNPEALGVSRVIAVDPTEHIRIGTMQYRETLPLEEGEVVLTFDDGPLPPYTKRVLEILASECVKATFFLVGRMAQAYPEVARQIHAAGHTIGTHSQNHPLTFNHMPVEKVEQEIDQGIASVTAALGSADQVAPFFRVPGLLRADDVESYLASRSLMTWSADFPADDWRRIGPAEIARRALTRLEAKGKGVLLLHDIHPATVLALPILFKELKARGYRIVQVVPASADHPKTATLPSQWLLKPSKDLAIDSWPRTTAEIPASAALPRLPAPGQHVFGIGRPFEIAATLSSPVEQKTAAVGRHKKQPPPSSLWPRYTRPPSILDLVSREELPVPNLESFGYPRVPAELPLPLPQRRAAAPLPASEFAELRPAVKEEPADITASIGRRSGAWPVTTATIPNAGFP